MNYKDEWLNGMTEIIGYNRGMCHHILFLIDNFKDNPDYLIKLIEEHTEKQIKETQIKFKQLIND